LCHLFGQGPEAAAALLLRKRPSLERPQVPLTRFFEGGEFAFDRSQLPLAAWPLAVCERGCALDGTLEEATVGECRGEEREELLLERVGRDPLGGAAFALPVAMAREAGVVAVAPASPVRSRADHRRAAVAAANLAREEVVRGVRSSLRALLRARRKKRLCFIEDFARNKRRVRSRVSLASPAHLADIDGVLEHRLDRGAAPEPAKRGAGALLVEEVGDCPRAEPLLRVELEDATYKVGLLGDRLEEARVGGDPVSNRWRAVPRLRRRTGSRTVPCLATPAV